MAAAGNDQLHLSPVSPDVFSITGHHRATDLLCAPEIWHDADSAVLGRLRGAAYNIIDRARPCTADDLSVNHGGVAIVAGADIALSPIDIADQPTTFEIVCACACVGCFAAIVVLLYQPDSQPLQQQQTFIDELTPVLERVKSDVVFMHRIVSYRDSLCHIVSNRFPLGPYCDKPYG